MPRAKPHALAYLHLTPPILGPCAQYNQTCKRPTPLVNHVSSPTRLLPCLS